MEKLGVGHVGGHPVWTRVTLLCLDQVMVTLLCLICKMAAAYGLTKHYSLTCSEVSIGNS